ncbi:MAG TPA: MoaD/ThiS family protein [Cyclobacteriaceae bacterium]|nr:MoaD/ThiS family protein [Cyclobacteriaceae bacterium]
MKCTIKAFGITKDILGGREVSFEMSGNKVGDLRDALHSRFPEVKSLNSLFIAVNNNYADDNQSLSETDEIALIPPVSGG